MLLEVGTLVVGTFGIDVVGGCTPCTGIVLVAFLVPEDGVSAPASPSAVGVVFPIRSGLFTIAMN